MIVNIKRTTNLNRIDTDIVLGTAYSVRNDVFSLEEIKKIVSVYKHKVYVNMDIIIHEAMILEIKDFLKKLPLEVSGIYFSDMGLYMLAKELGLSNKLIYNPGTLTTNSLDINLILGLGIKRVVLAREITLDEIKYINSHAINTEVLIHGKLNMFYSKRKLLSNYYKYRNIAGDYDKMFLVEETRDDKLAIIEDATGTHIFANGILNSYDEVKDLHCELRIDGYFLSDDELLEEIDTYQKILTNQKVKYSKEGKNSGFYYKKTVYRKK